MKYLALLLALVLPLSGQTLTNTTLDGVTNATINGKLDDDVSATHAALNLGTAATADTSLIGGANKIPKFDSLGNLHIGTPSGNPETDPFGYVGPGNLVMQNNKVFGAAKAGATPETLASGNGWIFRLQPWETHGGSVGNWIPETLFDITGSIAIIPTHRTQYGNNSSARDLAYMQFVSGSATSGDTLRASKGFAMRTYWWDGDSAERSTMGFQAVPTATTGTGNKVLKFWDDVLVYGESGDGGVSGTATQTGDFTGTQIGEMHQEGFWNPGISAAFTTLTPVADVYTQACSKYRTVQQAKLTLSTTNELSITGQTNGQRGVVFVSQDATGSRTLTLPSGSLVPASWVLSTTPLAVDRLTWEYDGVNFLWTITKGYTVGTDADVTSFASAGRANITDPAQITALNTFVVTLKGADLWTRFDAIYPFVGGNATAHSKNLKSDTYNITWPVAVAHSSNGITGNGAGYGTTGISLRTLGRTNSVSIYLYSKTDAPTDNSYWYGSTEATEWNSTYRFGANPYNRGPNGNGQGSIAGITDFSNDYIINRSTNSTYQIYSGAYSSGDLSNTVTNSPTADFPIMCRWNGTSYAGFTNMNMAMFAIGQSLSSAEWVIFRAAANAYQTALGRANP